MYKVLVYLLLAAILLVGYTTDATVVTNKKKRGGDNGGVCPKRGAPEICQRIRIACPIDRKPCDLCEDEICCCCCDNDADDDTDDDGDNGGDGDVKGGVCPKRGVPEICTRIRIACPIDRKSCDLCEDDICCCCCDNGADDGGDEPFDPVDDLLPKIGQCDPLPGICAATTCSDLASDPNRPSCSKCKTEGCCCCCVDDGDFIELPGFTNDKLPKVGECPKESPGICSITLCAVPTENTCGKCEVEQCCCCCGQGLPLPSPEPEPLPGGTPLPSPGKCPAEVNCAAVSCLAGGDSPCSECTTEECCCCCVPDEPVPVPEPLPKPGVCPRIEKNPVCTQIACLLAIGISPPCSSCKTTDCCCCCEDKVIIDPPPKPFKCPLVKKLDVCQVIFCALDQFDCAECTTDECCCCCTNKPTPPKFSCKKFPISPFPPYPPRWLTAEAGAAGSGQAAAGGAVASVDEASTDQLTIWNPPSVCAHVNCFLSKAKQLPCDQCEDEQCCCCCGGKPIPEPKPVPLPNPKPFPWPRPWPGPKPYPRPIG